MSNRPLSATPDQLVGALDLLDVHFLAGGVQDEVARTLAKARLMEGLAQSSEARIRSALIPLLLRHPELHGYARLAAANLPPARHTLGLYYTAAALLQEKYRERLVSLFGAQPRLPDLFSHELDLVLSDNVEESLARLAGRHAQLTRLELNWIATYKHAAERLIDYSEKKRRWAHRSQPHGR